MKPTASSTASTSGVRRTNSVYVKHFGNAVSSRTVFNYDNGPSQVWKRKGMVSMDSSQIAELFRLRPELSEYVYMEIQNARLSEDH
jgi:predicted secreted protein